MKIDRALFIQFLEKHHPEYANQLKANKEIMSAGQVEVKQDVHIVKWDGEKEEGDDKQPVEVVVSGDHVGETIVKKLGATADES